MSELVKVTIDLPLEGPFVVDCDRFTSCQNNEWYWNISANQVERWNGPPGQPFFIRLRRLEQPPDPEEYEVIPDGFRTPTRDNCDAWLTANSEISAWELHTMYAPSDGDTRRWCLRRVPAKVEPVAYTAETFPKGMVWERHKNWPAGVRSLVVHVDVIHVSNVLPYEELLHGWLLSTDGGETWHRACANWREVEGGK